MSIASTTSGYPRGFDAEDSAWADQAFSSRDLDDLRALGKEPAEAARELRILREGSKPLDLTRACTPGDGVLRLSESQRRTAVNRFLANGWRRQICKFVAAAGSASRMFRMFDSGEGSADERTKRLLCDRLPDLALFPALDGEMRRRGLDARRLAQQRDWQPIADSMLREDGLGLANLPKGLMPFHAYPDGARTALEEHIVEAFGYGVGYGNLLHLHAVVSPLHEETVAAHLQAASLRFRTANIRIKAETSTQSDSTQTVALDARGEILRDAAGGIVFRPAGHGAVLPNLNGLRGDIVFVRTVDNVLPDPFRDFVCMHKQALGGVLLETEAEVHACLAELSDGEPSEQTVTQAAALLESRLSTSLPAHWAAWSFDERRRFLIDRLNRPLRVCAVVPNGGKPGGAPFWVRTPEGNRLRIADTPEVDLTNEGQSRVWRSAPYFNPADLVCSVRDFRGKPFDLSRFQARDEWYVIDRHYRGQKISVLERSGLWNGAMAEWNTVFVETPSQTLRPVKTLLELLDCPELPQS